MLSGWRHKFGTSHKGLLGVEVDSQGTAIAQVESSPSGLTLRHCEFLSADAMGSTSALTESTLTDSLLAQQLGRLPCNWVLSAENYSLLLLEAPKVAPEEMREAVRWQIKDLINFPADQAILDIFDLPEDGRRNRHMIYVVAVARQHIEATVAQSRAARLKLASIDIGELALRNIAALLPADERGIAIVRIQCGRGSLVLIRHGHLYLSRHFDLPYQGGLHENLPEENLVLELQRSLDYYERQMAQEAPARILLCGDNIRADKITDGIRNSLTGELGCLTLSELLPGAENFDEQHLQLCVGAIGAALRREGD